MKEKLVCSVCNGERESNHYYCKSCKAQYQKDKRNLNSGYQEKQGSDHLKLKDNFNGWF